VILIPSKRTALAAVFLCLLFGSSAGCSVNTKLPQSYSAKAGVYNVKVVVAPDAAVKKHGRIAYYFKNQSTILLSDKNTLECAAHELGHALGWEHEEHSYKYCKNWGLE